MKKTYRVKKERDFQKVFQTGDSYANRKFVVYKLPKENQKHFRVGLSVGKKVGNAVQRNEVKRKIRAAVYAVKETIDPELDFIVIARPSTQGIPYEEIRSNLVHVLKLAKIINGEGKVREEI
ncbi:MAG: ribonuclease P protein component [Enterococcus sp.]